MFAPHIAFKQHPNTLDKKKNNAHAIKDILINLLFMRISIKTGDLWFVTGCLLESSICSLL